MRTGPNHHSTENDEFIARALAEQEVEEAIAARFTRQEAGRQTRRRTPRLNDYPGERLRHRQREGGTVPTVFPPPTSSSAQHSHDPGSTTYGLAPPPPPPPSSQKSRSTPQSQPFAFRGSRRQRVPMCHIPCVAGPNGVCVEMMVDTGAESSVISEQLATELGLHASMDRSQQGIAAGVGQARIVGQIRDAVVTLGHVEFLMDFMVLQVPDRLMLLGLDQMRKYKCIVDLEKDVLIFGGSGGVEVPMLRPDEQQHFVVPPGIGGGCTMS